VCESPKCLCVCLLNGRLQYPPSALAHDSPYFTVIGPREYGVELWHGGVQDGLMGHVQWLLANHSMKHGYEQYFGRVQQVTEVLVRECGSPPEHVWPLSVSNAARFLAYLQLLRRRQSTVAGYVAAIEWYHDIHAWPNIRTGPGGPFIRRVLDSIFRTDLGPARPRDGVTPAMLQQLISGCWERSSSPTDCWARLATIMALLFDGRGRIMEVLGSYWDRVCFMADGSFEILLPYLAAKTASLISCRRSLGSSCQRLVFQLTDNPNCGARLLGRWWRAWGSPQGGVPTPIFPSPQTEGPITYSTIRNQMRGLFAELGFDLDRLCTHSFRIGGATADFQAGVPIPDIRESLRHVAGSQSTFRYLPPGVRGVCTVVSSQKF